VKVTAQRGKQTVQTRTDKAVQKRKGQAVSMSNKVRCCLPGTPLDDPPKAPVLPLQAAGFAQQRLQRLQEQGGDLEEQVSSLRPYTDVVLEALERPPEEKQTGL
jgi:hypothetical protein